MSSLSLKAAVVLLLSGSTLFAADLKVCADPANLPFSNTKRQGFDNHVAELLARELNAKLEFHWARGGRGFVRNTVDRGMCDVLVGVPVGMKGLQIAGPYYRSSYVFITPAQSKPINSFDDPALKKMKIGVQVLDEDYAPPGRALARRGLVQNVVGYPMEGTDDGAIIRAVAEKKIDAAVVWGPLAGYYSKHFASRIQLTPVEPEVDPPALAFAFDMGIGVRTGDRELFDRVQRALMKRQPEIQQVLRSYGVPILPTRNEQAALSGGKR
jgi:mxaJ protein